MLGFSIDLSTLSLLLNGLIVVVWYLVRQTINGIKSDIKEISDTTKDIQEQVHLTNGNVKVLQQWKEDHLTIDAREHDSVNHVIANIQEKVDELWRGKATP